MILLRQFDQRLGLTSGFEALIIGERDARYVEHSALVLLRQRVYQLAAGYEDANDATFLGTTQLCAPSSRAPRDCCSLPRSGPATWQVGSERTRCAGQTPSRQ